MRASSTRCGALGVEVRRVEEPAIRLLIGRPTMPLSRSLRHVRTCAPTARRSASSRSPADRIDGGGSCPTAGRRSRGDGGMPSSRSSSPTSSSRKRWSVGSSSRSPGWWRPLGRSGSAVLGHDIVSNAVGLAGLIVWLERPSPRVARCAPPRARDAAGPRARIELRPRARPVPGRSASGPASPPRSIFAIIAAHDGGRARAGRDRSSGRRNCLFRLRGRSAPRRSPKSSSSVECCSAASGIGTGSGRGRSHPRCCSGSSTTCRARGPTRSCAADRHGVHGLGLA